MSISILNVHNKRKGYEMRKILDINYNGYKFKGYKADIAQEPFRLYETWWDMGEHKKLIGKYADFRSMMTELNRISIGM